MSEAAREIGREAPPAPAKAPGWSRRMSVRLTIASGALATVSVASLLAAARDESVFASIWTLRLLANISAVIAFALLVVTRFGAYRIWARGLVRRGPRAPVPVQPIALLITLAGVAVAVACNLGINDLYAELLRIALHTRTRTLGLCLAARQLAGPADLEILLRCARWQLYLRIEHLANAISVLFFWLALAIPRSR